MPLTYATFGFLRSSRMDAPAFFAAARSKDLTTGKPEKGGFARFGLLGGLYQLLIVRHPLEYRRDEKGDPQIPSNPNPDKSQNERNRRRNTQIRVTVPALNCARISSPLINSFRADRNSVHCRANSGLFIWLPSLPVLGVSPVQVVGRYQSYP